VHPGLTPSGPLLETQMESGTRLGPKALSCPLILEDSSIARAVTSLRGHAARLQVGDRLPSSRQLMAELGVGPVTVHRAVAQLAAEGVLTTRPGAGTYVAPPYQRPPADTGWQQVALGRSPVEPAGLDLSTRTRGFRYPMGSSWPDVSLRPDARLANALARAARRPDVWGAPPPAGLPELRSWFAATTGVDRDDVIISPGGQGALSATIRAIVPAGSPVLVSVPTYPGALAVLRSAGLIPHPVPTDHEGVRPDLLELALKATGARLVYLQPTFANPDGRVLATARRKPVLDAVASAGAFIIDDDWARWLGHGPNPAAPLIRDDHHGHVITISSLTKAAAPSLRIGAVSARGPVLRRIEAMRLADDLFVSQPLQEAAVELITSAAWHAHLRTLAATLRQRLEILVAAVAKYLPECSFRTPAGGVSIWLQLPRELDDSVVAERAAALGLAVTPGRNFNIGEGSHPHLRLAFGGIQARLIDEAIRCLAEAIEAAR
jgi:DNA-binding transcriptional MocR family regulator